MSDTETTLGWEGATGGMQISVWGEGGGGGEIKETREMREGIKETRGDEGGGSEERGCEGGGGVRRRRPGRDRRDGGWGGGGQRVG